MMLLYLCISVLGVNESLFYGAADVIYRFFMTEELADNLPQLSDIVYACIVIANEVRGLGNRGRESLMRLIFQVDGTNLRNRESNFSDLVKKVRSVVEPQLKFLRWGGGGVGL